MAVSTRRDPNWGCRKEIPGSITEVVVTRERSSWVIWNPMRSQNPVPEVFQALNAWIQKTGITSTRKGSSLSEQWTQWYIWQAVESSPNSTGGGFDRNMIETLGKSAKFWLISGWRQWRTKRSVSGLASPWCYLQTWLCGWWRKLRLLYTSTSSWRRANPVDLQMGLLRRQQAHQEVIRSNTESMSIIKTQNETEFRGGGHGASVFIVDIRDTLLRIVQRIIFLERSQDLNVLLISAVEYEQTWCDEVAARHWHSPNSSTWQPRI